MIQIALTFKTKMVSVDFSHDCSSGRILQKQSGGQFLIKIETNFNSLFLVSLVFLLILLLKSVQPYTAKQNSKCQYMQPADETLKRTGVFCILSIKVLNLLLNFRHVSNSAEKNRITYSAGSWPKY